jgi:hypothetical protein
MEYLNKDNIQINEREWRVLFEHPSYRFIARWKGENGAEITTIWVGIVTGSNHGPNGPLIFETLYCPPGEDQEMYKYATMEEALSNHERLVELAQTNPKYISGVGLVIDEDLIESRWKGIIEDV